jgi:Family of unknown function (DUF5681)
VKAIDDDSDERLNGATYEVGYCKPPVHTRFKPGQSGNPTGRPKDSPNLKTLFQKILKEQISLREGSVTKKISKAEAVMRGLVIGALKGDTRSVMTLLRIAEQTGEFEDDDKNTEIIVGWMTDPADMPSDPPSRERYPAITKLNRE